LTDIGRRLGLVDDQRWKAFNDYQEELALLNQCLKESWVRPGLDSEKALSPLLANPINREYRFSDMLKRPEIKIDNLLPFINDPAQYSDRATEQVEINSKYAGYLSRQQDEINKALKHESTELSVDLDYQLVKGLSNEVRQKLQDARPATIGQAGRISGITPAAISLLLVHLKRQLPDKKTA